MIDGKQAELLIDPARAGLGGMRLIDLAVRASRENLGWVPFPA
jgi:hypothetical protein